MDEPAEPVPVESGQAPEVGETDDGLECDSRFLLSFSKGRKTSTLHQVGGCWYAQARAWKDWEAVTQDPPPPDLYTAVCGLCWKGGVLDEDCVAAGMSDQSSLSGSDSQDE